jgi:hypothetical protein
MIPLLLIPQMILSGLLFSFDKLNDLISTKGKVPILADAMSSRWAYEAMAVYNFKNNAYEKPYYDYEKLESQADFRSTFLIDELDKKRRYIADNLESKNDSVRAVCEQHLELVQKTIREEYYKPDKIDLNSVWTLQAFNPEFNKNLAEYFQAYKKFYQGLYNKVVQEKERLITNRENSKAENYNLNKYKNKYYNESLADLVKNVSTKDRIMEYNGELIQLINPIFIDPKPNGPLDYRAQFFAPVKNFAGITLDTYLFNILVIWLMAIGFYITLYFELLRKLIDSFGKVNLPQKK